MQLAAVRSQVVAVALQLAFSCPQVAVHCVPTTVLGVKPALAPGREPVPVAQAVRKRQVKVMPSVRTMLFLVMSFVAVL